MKKFLVPLALLPFLFLLAAIPAHGGDRYEPRGMYPRPKLEEPKYYTCTEDKNCVTASLPCGRIVVLNTTYQKDVQGWADFVSPRYQCLASVAPQKADNISCKENVCRGDISQASPILEDKPINRNPAYCESIDDCAVVLGPCYKKIVVNKIYKKRLQEEYDKVRDMHMEQCFFPDNRTVERLHCNKNTCEADLKVPDQTYWTKPVDMRNLPKHE